MRTPSRSITSATGTIQWMLNLATMLLSRLLNMPEPMVHSTGVFVFIHVQAIETSVGRTLCPARLLRQFRNRLRRLTR
ncbi:MAG: hypothetical protein ACXWKP_27915 [Bradyrhizobium sp.]